MQKTKPMKLKPSLGALYTICLWNRPGLFHNFWGMHGVHEAVSWRMFQKASITLTYTLLKIAWRVSQLQGAIKKFVDRHS